jgi:DNA-binding transcriptional LysR family regulator
LLPALTLDEVALMKRAVRETDAVSWAPDVLIADEVRHGSFVPLPFRAEWARLNYGIIRRADKPVTPALEAFLSELRSVERGLRDDVEPRPRHRRQRVAAATGRRGGR